MAVPNLWRTKKQRYSLVGEVCAHCEHLVFPPREICPHCNKTMQAAPAPQAQPASFAYAPVAAQPALVAVVGDD